MNAFNLLELIDIERIWKPFNKGSVNHFQQLLLLPYRIFLVFTVVFYIPVFLVACVPASFFSMATDYKDNPNTNHYSFNVYVISVVLFAIPYTMDFFKNVN